MNASLRPDAVGIPMAVLTAMAAAVYLISRTTGSGWLLVLFCGMVAVIGLSAVLPAINVARVRVEVRGPRDATVGRPLRMRVSVSGPVPLARLRTVDPPGDTMRVDGPSSGEVAVVAQRRGLLDHVTVELRSGAPFGMLWWRRSIRVDIGRPLWVGPEPLDGGLAATMTVPAADSGGRGRATVTSDTLRGIRSFVEGDALRLVSWPATARHGRLMVKESEAPELTRLVVVVDLRGSEPEAESTARRAAGMANAALAKGMPVTLVTTEPRGPRVGAVASAVEVGRRLAMATPGVPPHEVAGPGELVVTSGPR